MKLTITKENYYYIKDALENFEHKLEVERIKELSKNLKPNQVYSSPRGILYYFISTDEAMISPFYDSALFVSYSHGELLIEKISLATKRFFETLKKEDSKEYEEFIDLAQRFYKFYQTEIK